MNYFDTLQNLGIEELRDEWRIWRQRSNLDKKSFKKEFDAAWHRFGPCDDAELNHLERARSAVELAANIVLHWEALEEKYNAD